MIARTIQNRRDEVLRYLITHEGEWVDGPDIANQHVGGSEGHRRVRELSERGYLIERRRHPNPNRSSWQYRLLAYPADEATRPTLWGDL